MSPEACTLTLSDLEEITESLAEQRDSVIRILSMANCAHNGGATDWEIIEDALRNIAAANVLLQDTIDNATRTS